MSALRELAAYVCLPDPRPIAEIDEEIREELAFHLEMCTLENLSAGMSLQDAERDALQRFGDLEKTRRACRRIVVGDRIMLQRIQAGLTVVLLLAVIYLGFALYRGQLANEAALARMAETLERIADNRAGNEAVTEPASVDSSPIVVETTPKTGDTAVDPALAEIRVTYNREMLDGSWSWSQKGEDTFPEVAGDPHYLADGKTCVLPVKLQPGRTYEIWLNSHKFHNFQDKARRPALPYVLRFQTRK